MRTNKVSNQEYFRPIVAVNGDDNGTKSLTGIQRNNDGTELQRSQSKGVRGFCIAAPTEWKKSHGGQQMTGRRRTGKYTPNLGKAGVLAS